VAQQPTLNLANIQGNVIAGFNKDHQRFLFVHFATLTASVSGTCPAFAGLSRAWVLNKGAKTSCDGDIRRQCAQPVLDANREEALRDYVETLGVTRGRIYPNMAGYAPASVPG
jgi:hypothetical protein